MYEAETLDGKDKLGIRREFPFGKIKISRTTTPILISMRHVISWSGGKDSTATVILFKKNWDFFMRPGDIATINFVEVMYDNSREISGHNPYIINFMHEKAKIFEEWNFEVNFLRADTDYLTIFHHKLKRSPDPNRIGMTWGFGSGKRGQCCIKRDCKLKPLNDWNKIHKNDEIKEYIGLAIDEPDRLLSMHKEKPTAVSLLEAFHLTEADARELCEEYDMLSPQYLLGDAENPQNRDGCWFCPNAKLCEHQDIYNVMPDIWEEYVSLEDTPNLAYPKWSCYAKESLYERNLRIIKDRTYNY